MKAPEISELSPVVQKQLKFAHGPGLDETMGLELMKALGISTLQTFFISEPKADIPLNLPYPLAVKVVSPDLLHKTEAGAIALGVGDKKEADAARDKCSKRTSSKPIESTAKESPCCCIILMV